MPTERDASCELTLIVLQREPKLLNGLVASGKRIGPMTTEVVIRALQVFLGALECRDCLTYLRMGLTPIA